MQVVIPTTVPGLKNGLSDPQKTILKISLKRLRWELIWTCFRSFQTHMVYDIMTNCAFFKNVFEKNHFFDIFDNKNVEKTAFSENIWKNAQLIIIS